MRRSSGRGTERGGLLGRSWSTWRSSGSSSAGTAALTRMGPGLSVINVTGQKGR